MESQNFKLPRITQTSGHAHSAPTAAIASDCRHYRGDKPCFRNSLCNGCSDYQPHTHRVCIIKIGALGDVVRTLCILPELRRQLPDAHITWVSAPAGCRMIDAHPMINRTLVFEPMTALLLAQEEFDLAINLDKEPEPCALMNSLWSTMKLGVGLSPHGKPVPLNPESLDYFYLGLSDDLKFHKNHKSYPQLVHEALGWPYRGQSYELPVNAARQQAVTQQLASQGWQPNRATLGVNLGAGTVFANKMWPAERIADVIEKTWARQNDTQVLLLGGPGEKTIGDEVKSRLANRPTQNMLIDTGTNHSEKDFVAVVDACDVLFAGDTMAMHVAIARRKHVVAVFGPTCHQEIDLFGRGESLIAKVPCAPCYKKSCDHNNICIEENSTDQAADAIARQLIAARTASYSLPVIAPSRKSA